MALFADVRLGNYSLPHCGQYSTKSATVL